jgi:hypothetical protein
LRVAQARHRFARGQTVSRIPPGIVSATLEDLATGKSYQLTTKPQSDKQQSNCHFAAPRVPRGEYEIGFRIDWSDLDASNSPTLDADFYRPGESRPIKECRGIPCHHTSRTHDPASGEWTYRFENESQELNLLLRLTCEVRGTIDTLTVK